MIEIEVEPEVLRMRTQQLESTVQDLLRGPHTAETGGQFRRANLHLVDLYSQLDDSTRATEARARAELAADMFPLPRYVLVGNLSELNYGLSA